MESLPEDFKPLLSYVLSGGSSLKDFIGSYVEEEDVTKLDIDSPDDQKEILRQYYKKTTKYDNSKIDKAISRIEKNGELLGEAADVLEELKSIYKEERTALQKEQEKAEQAREENIRKYRTNVTESLNKSDDIPSSRKGRVQAFLFNPITREDNKDTDFNRALVSISSNPQHLVQLADILLDYTPDKGINLERLNRRKKTEAVSQIRKKLETIVDMGSKLKGGKQTSASDDNFN